MTFLATKMLLVSLMIIWQEVSRWFLRGPGSRWFLRARVPVAARLSVLRTLVLARVRSAVRSFALVLACARSGVRSFWRALVLACARSGVRSFWRSRNLPGFLGEKKPSWWHPFFLFFSFLFFFFSLSFFLFFVVIFCLGGTGEEGGEELYLGVSSDFWARRRPGGTLLLFRLRGDQKPTWWHLFCPLFLFHFFFSLSVSLSAPSAPAPCSCSLSCSLSSSLSCSLSFPSSFLLLSFPPLLSPVFLLSFSFSCLSP